MSKVLTHLNALNNYSKYFNSLTIIKNFRYAIRGMDFDEKEE